MSSKREPDYESDKEMKRLLQLTNTIWYFGEVVQNNLASKFREKGIANSLTF